MGSNGGACKFKHVLGNSRKTVHTPQPTCVQHTITAYVGTEHMLPMQMLFCAFAACLTQDFL
jgi:hypothetical protein